MKNKYYVFLLALLMIFGSCLTSNCPDDEKIGDRPMSEKSKGFVNFKGNPKLIFKDNEGNKITFESPEGLKTEKTKISVYKQCTEFKFDGQSTYKYFEGQSISIAFSSANPNYSLGFGVYPSTLRPEEEMFYDRFVVDVSGVGSVGRGEIITDRYFSEVVDEKEFNLDNPMDTLEEITLNGVTFKDIYRTKDFDGRYVYYNKEFGVVGFIDKAKTFNLDTIIR